MQEHFRILTDFENGDNRFLTLFSVMREDVGGKNPKHVSLK